VTVPEILAWLERRGSAKNVAGMARYAIVAKRVFGVSVGDLREIARQVGRDHRTALALWKSGWYEARMLTAFVDEPDQVTPAQMERWAKDFDNWAICDAMCFHLFDKSPHAWRMVRAWSTRKEEFVKRAAFALIAGMALHAKTAPDQPFVASLRLIERGAADPRNFVKKGVSWALRAVGKRSPDLRRRAIALSKRLAASPDPAARWVGRDALRDLSRNRPAAA